MRLPTNNHLCQRGEGKGGSNIFPERPGKFAPDRGGSPTHQVSKGNPPPIEEGGVEPAQEFEVAKESPPPQNIGILQRGTFSDPRSASTSHTGVALMPRSFNFSWGGRVVFGINNMVGVSRATAYAMRGEESS